MTCFFCSSNLTKYDRINCKKYHNQETTEFFFKVPGVLFSTIFKETGLSQRGLAGLLMCPLQGAIVTKTNFRIENYNCIISQNKM